MSSRIIDARQRVRKLVEKRSQKTQALHSISEGYLATEVKAKDQTNRKDKPPPTCTSAILDEAPKTMSRGRRRATATASISSSFPIAGDYGRPCQALPAAGSGEQRLSMHSDPTNAAVVESRPVTALAPNGRPPSEPSSTCGSLRAEAPDEDGEVSGDGDALDDLIRDPITLEVRRASTVAGECGGGEAAQARQQHADNHSRALRFSSTPALGRP